MNSFERSFLRKAERKGLRFLELEGNRISFILNDEWEKITKNDPSEEFKEKMEKIYEEW